MLTVREVYRRMIVYPIGQSGQRLIFPPVVIEHFAKHRQIRLWQCEAGGQLFARIHLPEIFVEQATGPRRSDRRMRQAYHPNRCLEQAEIIERYDAGLHFIGDWHTHAEPVPCPSAQDARSMCELVERSQHALNGFVLVIVGSALAPAGLFVSVFDRYGHVVLRHEPGGS